MKLDKDRLKQKIKDNVTRERVAVFLGIATGVFGMVVGEYYRREYNKLLLDDDYFEEKRTGFDPENKWTTIDVPRGCLKDVEDGATLMYRKNGEGSYQVSTLGHFPEN
jgi:hypothetical protein